MTDRKISFWRCTSTYLCRSFNATIFLFPSRARKAGNINFHRIQPSIQCVFPASSSPSQCRDSKNFIRSSTLLFFFSFQVFEKFHQSRYINIFLNEIWEKDFPRFNPFDSFYLSLIFPGLNERNELTRNTLILWLIKLQKPADRFNYVSRPNEFSTRVEKSPKKMNFDEYESKASKIGAKLSVECVDHPSYMYIYTLFNARSCIVSAFVTINSA